MNRLATTLLVCVAAAPAWGQSSVSHFAPFGAMRVHYESYGTGPEALVFIHGWTCDLTFWRGQAPLYTTHRSLLIDLPGHGASGKPPISYSSDMFARSIEAVMRDAGVERAVLVGHSLGGPIAYAFFRQFPQRVKALVLVDAYVTPPSESHVSARQQQIADQAYKVRLDARAEGLMGAKGRKEFTHEIEAMFSPRTPEAMREEIKSKMLATPDYVRAAAVTSISSLPAAKMGLVYDVPAVAIQAGARGLEQRYEAMRTLFPRLQLERWNGYGHFLMMEDPARFNQAVESFLSTLR